MQKRRTFIKLFGKGLVGSALVPPFLTNCGNSNNSIHLSIETTEYLDSLKKMPIKGISPSASDEVILAEGLNQEIIIKWGDAISESDTFGFNNDFTCFIPLDKGNPNDGLLFVNHEYPHSLFVSGYNYLDINSVRTKGQVDQEMYSLGASIIRIKKNGDKWQLIENDPLNRRITAQTPIPFNWKSPIAGSSEAIGTHSNCSGGITPWGTVLTCEENSDIFYSETDDNGNRTKSIFGWEQFYDYPAEHYGWIVEIDPITGKSQKHVALGRFAHECCTLIQLEDKRIVAYTGDDKANEFIYKFVSSKANSLTEGTLYVADTINGKWLSLNIKDQPLLQENFKDQTEVLVNARKAARLIGATPQDRPEDIEIDPIDGSVLITLTNNYKKENYHGSILKIVENDNHHDALTFSSEALLTGGPETGFACPDNLAFDLSGNLWFTSDMPGSEMNKEGGIYEGSLKNNGLYVVPRYGEQKGEIIQVASAPIDAEFTGPWFSPDYKTLFLSVQHPGEQSESLEKLTSKWPHDKDGIPKPSVIAINGKLLDKFIELKKLDQS